MESKNHLITLSFVVKSLLLMLIIILLTSKNCFAQFEPFTQVTDDDYEQTWPSIDGDFIVYEDNRTGGEPDIYFYNINNGVEKVVNVDPAYSSTKPDISGNRIVWQDNRNGDWDLYMYDIHNPDNGAVELIIWEGDQVEPAIWGDILVFSDKKPANASYNIYMLDFSTGVLTRLTNSEDGDQRHPDVYDQFIVWQDYRNDNWDIYMYNILKNEITALTDDPNFQIHPAIHGRRVVWEDYRDGDANIYMHHLTFGLGNVYENYDWPVFTGPFPYHNKYNQINPSICGEYLVFQDNRNGNFDIYLYSFFNDIAGYTSPLIEETNDQKYPVISGDRVVWHDDRRGEDKADIWMWTRPPGADLAVIKHDIPDPVPIGAELTYQIYVRNYGPQDATGVKLIDYLPPEVAYKSVQVSKNCTWSRVGNDITFDLGSIPNGSTDTITILVQTTVGGEIENTAIVSANEDDEITGNNQVNIRTEVKWQIPQKIDEGENPGIAVDPNEHIHIVYYVVTMGGSQLYYANNKSGVWNVETILTDDFINSADLDVDSRGKVHIAYGQMNNLKYVNDTSGSWSSPVILGDKEEESRSVSLEIDSKDNVHICYLYSMWNNGELRYITNKSGSWTTNTLSDLTYNSMSMALDKLDHLHIVFYSFHNQWGITYLTNSPDENWKMPKPIEAAWRGGQLETLVTDIAVDNANNLHVSYVGAGQVVGNEDNKYAYKPDDDWGYTIVDEGDFAGTDNAITIDDNNKPHMVYYHRQSEEIRYARHITSGPWEIFPVEFNTYEEGLDILSDQSGYIHIVYVKEGKLYYVTDRPAAPKPKVPQIKVTPQELDFVIRNVGDTTDIKQAIIKNVGEANLVIDDIRLVWRDSIDFSIAGHTCNVLNPDSSCVVDVRFNPQSIGDKHALLWIESNDPNNPEEGVSLKGKGLAPIIWDKGDPHFYEVKVNDTLSHEYIIWNKGNTNLVVDLVTIDGVDADQFFFDDLPETPFSIEDGDSTIFLLSFAPTSTGLKEATLRIFSHDLDLVHPIDGTGVLVPEIISFNPKSGPIKSEITIQGINFSDNPADNIVFFGHVKATEITGNTTSLTVKVPKGANSSHIGIINDYGRIAYTNEPFTLTFSESDLDENSFAESVELNTGNTPFHAAIGDLNADNLPDIVVNNNKDDQISVFLNTSIRFGMIRFTEPVAFPTGTGPILPVLGDLNGDGLLDVLISNADHNTFTIYQNISSEGNLDLKFIDHVTTNFNPTGIAVKDLDLDGKQEVIVANLASENISVYRNISTKDSIMFDEKIDIDAGIEPRYIVAQDLDGDSYSDIAVTNYTENAVSLLKNTSHNNIISFEDRISYEVGVWPLNIIDCDMDHDGKQDLVVYSDDSLFVLLNKSQLDDLQFEDPKALQPSIFLGNRASVGFLNGDEYPDLILPGSSKFTIYQKEFPETLSFKKGVAFANIDDPYSFTIGDLDVNGRPDIVVVNRNNNSISIFRNITTKANISGTIKEPDDTPVTEGVVFIIELNEDGTYGDWLWKPLEGSSFYEFVELPKNTKMVAKFNPDRQVYPNYMITYHQSASFIEEANLFELSKDTADIDIKLIATPPPPKGDTDVLGSITEENVGGRSLQDKASSEGIPVFLLNKSNNDILAYTVSDENGNFIFKDIPPGTYVFKADYSGYSMDQESDEIIIDKSTQQVTIGVTISKPLINAKVLEITGLEHLLSDQSILIYPNPCINHLNIKLNRYNSNKLMMQLYNGQGKLIKKREVNGFEDQFSIPMTSYSKGIYLLVIKSNDFTAKKVILKN